MKKSHFIIMLFTVLANSFFSPTIYADTSMSVEENSETPKTTPASKIEKYENKEKNYAIDYPAQWLKKDLPKLDLVLFAPPKEPNAQPLASMNIVAEKIDTPVTLEIFYKESIDNLSSALKDVSVIKSGETKFQNVASKWVQYSHEMQGMKFEVLQYFIVNGDMIYLITFSSTAENYAEYRPLFELIASSFRLLSAK